MAGYKDFERLKVKLLDDGILDVVCHFVGKRNSYEQQCHYELPRVWSIISYDRDVKAVVLRGHAGVLGAAVRRR
jgi:enoyl-CoA hydratase/carnithine racemase